MASSPLTLLVLFAVARGVLGADKELGQTCDPAADICVHPTLLLTCDAFAKKCFIQQDQACSGDGHKYLCVTGAECDGTTNKCKCEGSVYTASGAGCSVAEDKYAGACPSGGTCTAASNLLCASSFCGCTDATFEPDLSDGTCAAIPVEKKGRPCDDSNKATACGATATTHLECDTTTSNACQCVASYYGVNGGVCSEIPVERKDRPCDDTNKATACGATATTHLECDTATSNACQCVANYYGVTGGVCYPEAGQLNGGCSSTCTAANTVCTGSTAVKKCVCATGYSVDTAGTACEITPKKVGGSCTGGPDKQGTCEDANAECSLATSGTCSCKEGYSGPNGGSCVADNKVGGACTGTADTQASCEDTNALCTNSICTCKDGYSGTSGGSCTKIADNKVGGSCTADTANTKGTCEDANAVCPTTTGGFCGCKSGYAGIPGGSCAEPNKLGGECTTMTKDTKGTCEDANAVCSAQVNGRCYVKNGAMGMAASVTSLLLVAIVCLLTMN